MMMVACGAKDDQAVGTENLVQPLAPDSLKDETPQCYDTNKACPGYIAKIVSMKSNLTEHCTGVLVDQNTIMTSASCLDEAIREEGKNCSKHLYFFFPNAKNYPAAMYNCTSVLRVSAIDPNRDPSLWNNNMALLRVSSNVPRETLKPINAGLTDARSYELWKVTTESANGGAGSSFIKRFTCDIVKENYANPFNVHPFSPNSTIGNCTYTDAENEKPVEEKVMWPGSEGGALLFSGKLVGLLGKVSYSEEAFNELKTKGIVHNNPNIKLRPMSFVTNLACIEDFYGGIVAPECFQANDEVALETKRKTIATSNKGVGLEEALAKIRENTKHDTSKKVEWITQFSEVINQQIFTKHIPKCYYKTDQWIKIYKRFLIGYPKKKKIEIAIPGFVIDIKLDGLLRPSAEFKVTPEPVKYEMKIRPRDISKKKASKLEVKGSFAGVPFDEKYEKDNKIPLCAN